MAFVVTEACIRCKYMECVEVCPVDCFYEGGNMVVIDPEICTNCGVCVQECPVGAIVSDKTEEGQKWLQHNYHYSMKWPHITKKGTPPTDSQQWEDIEDKFNKFFNPDSPKREP